MKKIILTTATILAGLTIAGCADNTVASSTAGKISQDELYEAMKTNVGSSTLQQLIIKDVLTGFTDVSYKETIHLNLLIEEAVKENSKFTDKEIKAAYDAYTPPITASHILVDDEAKAKELISELNDGADFATLAKENSTDTNTAENGGEVTFSAGEMVPEFEEAANKLEEGKITTEPVKSEYGYHIIKLDKKSKKGSLEEERKTIEKQLLQDKLADSAAVQSILSKIMQDANVVINDTDLSTAMDSYLKKPDSSTEKPATSYAVAPAPASIGESAADPPAAPRPI